MRARFASRAVEGSIFAGQKMRRLLLTCSVIALVLGTSALARETLVEDDTDKVLDITKRQLINLRIETIPGSHALQIDGIKVLELFRSQEFVLPDVNASINYGSNVITIDNGTATVATGIGITRLTVTRMIGGTETFTDNSPTITGPGVVWLNAPDAFFTDIGIFIDQIRSTVMTDPPPNYGFVFRQEGLANATILVLMANGEDIITLTGSQTNVLSSSSDSVSYNGRTLIVNSRDSQGIVQTTQYDEITPFIVQNGFNQPLQRFDSSSPPFIGPGQVWVRSRKGYFTRDSNVINTINSEIVTSSIGVVPTTNYLVNMLDSNNMILQLNSARDETFARVSFIRLRGGQLMLLDSFGQFQGTFNGINQFSIYNNNNIETVTTDSDFNFDSPTGGTLFVDNEGNAFFSTLDEVTQFVRQRRPDTSTPQVEIGLTANSQGTVSITADRVPFFMLNGAQSVNVPSLSSVGYAMDRITINNNFNQPVAQFSNIELFSVSNGIGMLLTFNGSAQRTFAGPGTLYVGADEAFYTTSSDLLMFITNFWSQVPTPQPSFITREIGPGFSDVSLTLGGQEIVTLTGSDAVSESISSSEALIYSDNEVMVIDRPIDFPAGNVIVEYNNNIVTVTNTVDNRVDTYEGITSLQYDNGVNIIEYSGSAPSGTLRGGQFYFSSMAGTGRAFLTASSVINDAAVMAIENTGVVRRVIPGVSSLTSIVDGMVVTYQGSANRPLRGGGQLYVSGGSGFYTTDTETIRRIMTRLISSNPVTTTTTRTVGGDSNINVIQFNRTLTTVSGAAQSTVVQSGVRVQYANGSLSIIPGQVITGVEEFSYFDGVQFRVFTRNSSAVTFMGPGTFVYDMTTMSVFFTTSSQAGQVISNRITSVRNTFVAPEVVRPAITERVSKALRETVQFGTSIILYAGAQVTFNCTIATANPSPAFTFFRGNRSNILVDGPNIAISGNQLIISNLVREDSDMYGCIATNPVGSTIARSQLTVESAVAPTIDGNFIPFLPTVNTRVIRLQEPPQPEEVTLNNLRELILSCKFDGRPKPDIVWFRDTMILEISPSNASLFNYSIAVLRPGVSTLTIFPPFDTATTPYSCQAVGVAGSATGGVTIIPEEYNCMSSTTTTDCDVTCGIGTRQRMLDCTVTRGGILSPVNFSSVPSGLYEPIIELCGFEDPISGRVVECPGSRALPFRFRLSIGPWSECNRTCGTGCQNRTVECIRFVAESGSLTNPETVNISFCELDGKIIPRTVRMCNMFPCPFWWTGAFGECSVTCGGGVSTRVINCRLGQLGRENEIINDRRCNILTRPDDTKSCCDFPCPSARGVGVWSPCINFCQSRDVFCFNPDNDMMLEDALCDALPPLHSVRHCGGGTCLAGIWATGFFGACSVSCGSGVRTRPVICINNTDITSPDPIDEDYCLVSPKPSTSAPCFERNCPGMCVGEPRICPFYPAFGLCGLLGADCCISCPQPTINPDPVVPSPIPTPSPFP